MLSSTPTLMVSFTFFLFSTTFAIPLLSPRHDFSDLTILVSNNTVIKNVKWPDNPKYLEFLGAENGGILGGILPSISISIGLPLLSSISMPTLSADCSVTLLPSITGLSTKHKHTKTSTKVSTIASSTAPTSTTMTVTSTIYSPSSIPISTSSTYSTSSTSSTYSSSTSSTSTTSTIASSTASATPSSSSSSTPTSSSSSSTPTPTVPTSPYKLVQSHSGSTFLDGWDFFTSPDPTHGQVNFVNQADANNYGLTYTTSNGSTIMRVDDYTYLASGQNRNSVRVTSKESVKIGSIVVMDAVMMPFGPSVWPAFWSVGQNWPSGGEIDIVEGVHDNVQNQMTLHTAPGCTLEQPMQASGNVLLTNCDVYSDSNSGCGVQDVSTSSYGSGFNIAGGGVYVMYWDTTGISIWLFLRGNIPADIAAEQPNFQNWGQPRARFGSGTCDMNQFFSDQTLVFDITLCGDWAGNTYNQAGFSGTCSEAVTNPGNYQNAAWEVNYVKVYSM